MSGSCSFPNAKSKCKLLSFNLSYLVMAQSLDFKDQVVLITGAGGGLGREYALLFAARGAKVIVNDLGGTADGGGKSESAADKVVEEIRSAGGSAVANYESVLDGEELVQKALAAYGRIDILVNNAGILRDHTFKNMSTQDWDSVYNVHLRGAFLVTKAVWPHMCKQRHGKIIMTTSTSGIFGNFGQANYAAAKLGLLGLSNTLALEGAKFNILCNTIAPIADSRLTKSSLPEEFLTMCPPKLVAPFLLYLCHNSCKETGGLFYIAGGAAKQLRWQASNGANLLSEDHEITPEMVRDNWAQINNWSNPSYPKSSSDMAGFLSGSHQGVSDKPPAANSAPGVFQYTFKDVIKYALGVGVKIKQDFSHLKFLYEGHNDFSVLPTFGVIAAQESLFDEVTSALQKFKLNADPAKTLHGEHYLELYRPLPPNGMVKTTTKVVDILDKGSGAVVVINATSSDEQGPVCFNQFVVFALGAGGFGGPKHSEGQKPLVKTPSRPPDAVEVEQIPVGQATLYRLSGDLNPLHVDPDFAAIGGFQAPILHGLCSLGHAVRHVIKHFCGDDVTKFKALKVRFSKPILPGQSIRTEMWKEGNRVFVQCKVAETGSVILTGAYVDLHGGPPAKAITPSAVKSDALFQLMSDRLPSYPHLVKKVQASFLWRITHDGKIVSEWTTDFTKAPGSVYAGKPSGKASCTVTIADEDFVKTAMGQANPQQLFMKGKIKVAGNIMLAQKLQVIMKEIDLKKEVSAEKPGAKTPSGSCLKSEAVFQDLSKRLASMPGLVKKVNGSFLWNVTKNGKTAGQWFVDLKSAAGRITAGAPTTKPDCTLTISDDDLVAMFGNKANATQLFMKGKLKVSGNLSLTQKLGELLKSQAKL